MAEPLKIGVEVNVADISKLSAAAQEVMQNVRSLNEQFQQGAITADELAAGIRSQATAYVAATPAITEQIAKLTELKAVQEGFQAAAKESAGQIFGPTGATPAYVQNYGAELKGLESITGLVNAGQKQLAATLAGTKSASDVAAAGAVEVATAQKSGAVASAEQAAGAREAQATMSQAGREALQMSEAMLAGSEAVQTTGRTFIGLSRDLAITREALLETKAAMAETAAGTDQAAALESKYQKLLVDEAVLNRTRTEAEVQYKAALSESYTTQLGVADARAKAAAQEAAALLQKQQAEQATADAAAAEAAAGEGMVSADVEAATAAYAAGEAHEVYKAKVLATADANRTAAAAARGTAVALSSAGSVSTNTASQAEVLARKLQLAGMTAADISSTLQNNFSLSAKEAGAVIAGLGNSANQTSPQLTALISRATSLADNMRNTAAATKLFQASAGEIRGALSGMGLSAQETAKVMAQLAQQMDPGKVEQFTRQLAYSAIRMGATEGQVGQLGFAFARLGSIMPGVASLFAAAFPIFAAVAAIQILGQLSTKMEEWRDAEQKAADEAAKFERAIIQSSEAVARMEEKLAGAAGPLAEVEERMANLGGKAINLSSDVELMNKHLADAPGMWTKLGAGIAGFLFHYTEWFRSSAEDSRTQIDLFTRSLADNVKTANDLPYALAAIDSELERVTADLEKYKTSQLISPEAGVIKTFEGQIAALRGMREIIQNEQKANDLERLTEQQSLEEKLTVATESAQRARIELAASHYKEQLKLNQISQAQEITDEVSTQKQLTAVQLSGLAERESRLAAVKRLQPNVDFSSQEKAFQEERIRIVTDGQKRVDEVTAAGKAKIASENLALQNAEIAGEEKVTLAYMKREEARLRTVLNRADTPETIEAAAIPLIEQVTAQYEKETDAIKARAKALIETKLPQTDPLPTAKIGTFDFTEEINNIQKKFPTLATEVYTQLIEMNNEIMAIRERGALDEDNIEKDKTNRIREYHREELTNSTTELKNQLITERDSYQEGLAALQGSLIEHTSGWAKYFTSVQTLAEKNRSDIQGILNSMVLDDVAAANARIITAEELQRKLDAIKKLEEQADKQMHQREFEAAKEAVRKEEEDIDRMTNKIAEDFVRAGNQILTTHESIGRAAVKLGAQLELYIIDQGIKKVVTHYATALLQMVAEDNSTAARILGIHVAGAAAQNTLQQGQVVKNTVANAAQTTSVAAANTAQTVAVTAAKAQQNIATTAQTAVVTAQQTVQTGATVASQAAQTGAVAAGSATRANIDILAGLKHIIHLAYRAAADAFTSVMDTGIPFPINVVLATAAATGAFATVMAFGSGASAEGGTVVGAAGGHQQEGAAQPVLVHSGEVITDVGSLHSMASGAGGVAMAKVPSDQVSMLHPGSVVVPRSMAGGLASAAGGVTAVAPGIAPPLGLRESPQRLPSSMAGMIQGIIAKSASEGYVTFSAAGGHTVSVVPIRSASGGMAYTANSSASGVYLSAAAGLAPEQMETVHQTMNATPSAAPASGTTNVSRHMQNHIHVEVHNHGGEVDHDAIIASVRRGIRHGELR